MSVRKKPYLGEKISIFAAHEVVKVSDDLITIEVTRFKGIEPAGTGRMDIPIDYLGYYKKLKIFFLKKEYHDWFREERRKIDG